LKKKKKRRGVRGEKGKAQSSPQGKESFRWDSEGLGKKKKITKDVKVDRGTKKTKKGEKQN